MMYAVQATNKTPMLSVDSENYIVTIKGRSIHEDPMGFYDDLFDKCQRLVASNPSSVKLIFELAYYNSSSAIIFRDLIKIFAASSSKLTIEWRHEADDDEMRLSGEEFKQLYRNVDFHFVVLED